MAGGNSNSHCQPKWRVIYFHAWYNLWKKKNKSPSWTLLSCQVVDSPGQQLVLFPLLSRFFLFIFFQPRHGMLLTLPSTDPLKPLDQHSLHFHSLFSSHVFFKLHFQKIHFAWSQMVTDVKVLQIWPQPVVVEFWPFHKPLPVRSQSQNISIIKLFSYFSFTNVDSWPEGSASVNKFNVLWPQPHPRSDAPVDLPFAVLTPVRMSAVLSHAENFLKLFFSVKE